MAENNSSAPLKTAEGAYPALPKPDYPAQFDGHGGEQSSDESYSAEQMRAYAVQAVAAQAAPAAVAVPPKAITASLMLDDGGERPVYCLMAAYPSEADARAALAALAATPKPPATEDSSAGDLAEATHQTKLLAQALGDCILASGIVRSDLDMNGPQLLMFAEDLKELLLARQAEVKAKPVALHDDAYTALQFVEGQLAAIANRKFQSADTIEPVDTIAKAAKRAKAALNRLQSVAHHFDTAPQAQPADALDAAARDVLAERRRQVEVEGFTYSHDDSYTDGELAQAAACYAASSQSRDISYMSHLWPWPNHAWKPSTTRNDLLKAGALILAELERINRARAAMAAAQEGGKAAKEA